jgi:16S rRNA (cytosine967-C5)-methyltransferase
VRDGGRIAAAIEVLGEMATRHRPAHLALKAWGERARYAGAKDRAFVSGLALDALRHRRSLAWMMGEASERAVVLGVLRFVWNWPVDRLQTAGAEAYGPGQLTELELGRLAQPILLDGAPSPVAGDYPDWLDPQFERAFGALRRQELEAMAARAPVDLRVNTLKTDDAHVLKALAVFHCEPVGFPAHALRIAPPAAAERAAPVEATPEFEKGWFEVQDQGSQIAAAIAGQIVGAQILDFCAGGGGKTLALAAAMENTGQLYAYDSDARRLAETVKRARRAGVRNLQVRSPLDPEALKGLEGRMDLAFVDAPCTGSGTWRRHPDAKWRLTEAQLNQRMAEQDQILQAASIYVKPGGRLIYVTCSLLAEENEDRVAQFLAADARFAPEPPDLAETQAWRTPEGFLRLTPLKSGCDGFFAAALRRRS